jgi:gliding motility-associated-like protein
LFKSPSIVTVSVTPTISLSVSSNTTVCYGASITLTTIVSGGNGNYQYSWLPNHETTASVIYTVNASQQYTVSVGDGCTTSAKTISISVSTKPTVKLFPPIIGCAPLCVHYYDSTLIQSGNIATWNWSFDNGQSSNLASPTICFTSAGSYSGSLNVITTNNCTYKLCDINGITVAPQPQADFTSNIGFESTEDNSTFIFTNTSSNFTNIVWKDPTTLLFGNSITENYPDQGTYLVTLIATNSAGCVDSITKSIKVDPEFTFYAPNTFTPNDNGLNDTFLPMGTGWDPTSYTLSVFDRWGVQIFYTNDVSQGWDATYKGQGEKVQEGVYTWKVGLKDVFHKQHDYIGHVAVLK